MILDLNVKMGTDSDAGDITFAGKLDSSVGFEHNLTLDAGKGNIEFKGDVGAVSKLGDVMINNATNKYCIQEYSYIYRHTRFKTTLFK